MCVGDMGSHDKRSEIVIGDAFKLGSQLERVSKIYAVEIVAGATTRQQAQGFSWQELDRVRVKGKIDAVYSPLPQSPLVPAQLALHSDTEIGDELTVWAVPLQACRLQHEGPCLAMLSQLQGLNAEKYLYQLHAQRVRSLCA